MLDVVVSVPHFGLIKTCFWPLRHQEEIPEQVGRGWHTDDLHLGAFGLYGGLQD